MWIHFFTGRWRLVLVCLCFCLHVCMKLDLPVNLHVLLICLPALFSACFQHLFPLLSVLDWCHVVFVLCNLFLGWHLIRLLPFFSVENGDDFTLSYTLLEWFYLDIVLLFEFTFGVFFVFLTIQNLTKWHLLTQSECLPSLVWLCELSIICLCLLQMIVASHYVPTSQFRLEWSHSWKLWTLLKQTLGWFCFCVGLYCKLSSW